MVSKRQKPQSFDVTIMASGVIRVEADSMDMAQEMVCTEPDLKKKAWQILHSQGIDVTDIQKSDD